MNNTKTNIILDQKGICINGTYEILLASSLFYFRIPREKWAERMTLLKVAGYNTIDVYFPWNYHETSPGQWNFDNNREVKAFLQLAYEHELYVIARPGPYICSEWDGGALPAWLASEKINVRQDDELFLEHIGTWYDHILSQIEPFQITKGGTVICMQIENELDFFDCKSPVTYMEKLMIKAENLGIDVPLFYCCGQNDLLRGGGLTPGLYTAYNIYADASQPGLEERALHLWSSLKERNMPLLVTETNREHSFLKRLLACGAKLLSPYNQTAGTTIDWYNGLTNWGTDEAPLSLMATDYDFTSMIGSAGEVNEQFYEARLLAGLLRSFPEAFGEAFPELATQEKVISNNHVSSVLPMLHTPQGNFIAVSNLGSATIMELHTQEGAMELAMPKMYTKLLPSFLQLSKHKDIILCATNYELCYMSEQDGLLSAGFYGSGSFQAIISIMGTKKSVFHKMKGTIETFTMEGICFTIGTLNEMGSAHIPGLPDMARKVEEQFAYENLPLVATAPFAFKSGTKKVVPILPMEKLGQYRGIGCYEIALEEDSDILLQNASDILTIIHDNQHVETLYSRGGTHERHWTQGSYDVYTEIWGHSNFDDIRCKSLSMGSLKGISNIITIIERQDISDNWLFDLDEQTRTDWYFFRHSSTNTIMGIDSYNRAVSPLRTVYDKWVQILESATSHILHFSKAQCMIYVYVNGHYEGTVIQDDPYLDISKYAGNKRIQITLRLERRYFSDKAGIVTLLSGTKQVSCNYSTLPVEEIKMPPATTQVPLPIQMAPGSHTLITLPLTPGFAQDCKLIFKGHDVKLTVIWNHRIVGRLLLNAKDFPVVKGGRDDVLFLCKEWLEQEAPLIWCQGVGENPRLEEITLCKYDSVFH